MWHLDRTMRRLSLSLTVALLLVPGLARAAGFYLTDVGTRGMARGGAFIAAPDSLLAVHYNPAGLSELKGFQFAADLQLVNLSMRYERKCPCLPATNPNAAAADAELQAIFDKNPAEANTVLAIPYLSVGYGLPFLDLTIALAAWGPTSGRHNWGELPSAAAPSFIDASKREVTRYSGLEMRTLEANFGLGIGLRPLPDLVPGLRLGGTLLGYQSGNRQTVSIFANVAVPAAESPERDVPAVLDFLLPFGLNWQLGASYEIIPGLTLGTSYRGKRSFTTDGTLTAELPASLQGIASVQGQNIEVSLATAPIWRTGLEYRLPGIARVEGAFVWEGWSAHNQVTITSKDIIIVVNGMNVPLPPIPVPREWKDSWSLRLGGELNLLEPFLGVQAGYYYEPSAIPEERMDASRVDASKHGFSLGLNTTFFGATLSIGGQYVLLSSVQVTNGVRTQIAPFVDTAGNVVNPELITVVNNGNYSGHYFIGSASLTFALDPLLGLL